MEEKWIEAKLIRLSKVSIKNFKNVVYGELSLENPNKEYRASILGLFGQNGSGKTALIDIIELLKYILCGSPIPNKFANYINVDAEFATISYEFKIDLPIGIQKVLYQVSIQSTDVQSSNLYEIYHEEKSINVFNEIIKCPMISNKKMSIGTLINTTNSDIFTPISKRILLTGKGKKTITDLIVAKKISNKSSCSFIFSKELINIIRNNIKKQNYSSNKDLYFYYTIIENLVYFGNICLFVINDINHSLTNLNIQALLFKYYKSNLKNLDAIIFSLDKPIVISKNDKLLVEKIINSMNIVLQKIVPGLNISVKNFGVQIMSNGEQYSKIEFVSCKNNKQIALKYESDGIKRIISILQLLIAVYNEKTITVAIDELDSKIFEYIFGEILEIISEKGSGQLIFTSHNFRALEKLDQGFIAFTTTDAQNRYIRIKNIKNNINPRDFYYRYIYLSEDSHKLYNRTNNAEISFAFREAGELDEV